MYAEGSFNQIEVKMPEFNHDIISGRFAVLTLLLVVVIATGTVTADLASTPWPKFQQNNLNNGLSVYSGPQTNTLKWTYATSGTVTGSPAIGTDGTLYIGNYYGGGSYVGDFYALNPTGTLKWKFATGAVYGAPVISSDGTIYVGGYNRAGYGSDQNGTLYAFNPDGSVKWTFPTGIGTIVYGSPVIGSDGTVYVGNYNNPYLFAINPDGTEKWRLKTGSFRDCTPAIGADGTIYIADTAWNLSAINPDGTTKWIFTAAYTLPNSPSIGSDGTIYIGCSNGQMYAINPDGTQKWVYNSGGSLIQNSCPAIGSDGTIYIGVKNTLGMHAVYPNGTQKWTFNVGSTNGVSSSAAIGADGTIYFGAFSKKVYALNPDGTMKWSYTTPATIRSSPAIGSDGTLYIGVGVVSGDNRVYAFKDVAPVAAFSANTTSGTAPVTVKFTDLSTGNLPPTSWQWAFGDSTPNSTEQSPSHTYTSSGNFTVILTATNSVGSSSITKTHYINIAPPTPTIYFEPSSPVITVGAAQHYNLIVNTLPSGLAGFNLTLSLVNPSIGRIMGYTPAGWMALNGSSALPATSLTFNGVDLGRTVEAGATNVSIGTIDIEGLSPGMTSFTITVQKMDADGGAAINPDITPASLTVYQPLVADFTADHTLGIESLLVNFTDLTSGSPSPSSWMWTFGDSSFATDQNPSHTYMAVGSYNVSLLVNNTYCGSTVTKNAYIRIVHYVEPFPEYTLPPTDTDGDFLCEDINGNGRLDFDDVVAFYTNMDWIRSNTSVGVEPFDYNGNGRIDYDDVVRLYLEVLNG